MRKVVVIGLCGSAGCGKDAVADCLVSRFGYQKIRFAAFLYKMIYQLPFLEEHRWIDREWKESVHPFYGVSPRRMLQTLGTEWGRDLVNTDMWVKIAELMIEQYYTSKRFFVFPDMRFRNEADWLHKVGGLSVKITRPERRSTIRDQIAIAHSSESYLFDSHVQFLNDGTLQDLKDKVIELDVKAHAYSRKSQ